MSLAEAVCFLLSVILNYSEEEEESNLRQKLLEVGRHLVYGLSFLEGLIEKGHIKSTYSKEVSHQQ